MDIKEKIIKFKIFIVGVLDMCRYNNVAILHSELSDGEKYDEWRRIARGEASIVIGARSAIFAPLEDIGIIIIDEEHESSYIQENMPKYDARMIARIRARNNNAICLLGSATPSIDEYYKAKNGVYLTNDRSDTVYFVDRSLNVTPKFVATRHYDKDMNLVCPIMETDEYILFCNKMNMGARDNNRFEFANYIYVKKQNKIYKITPGCPIADYNAVPFEDYLLKDYLRVHPYFNTLNSNIMVCPLSIEYLKSHYETLPEELKSIAGKAHPDDNPVLMIMRFGKQLPKVSSLVQ